jgi:hypothetical protein
VPRINTGGFLFFLIAGFILLVQVMTTVPKIHLGFLMAYLLVMFMFWPIQIAYHKFVIQKKDVESCGVSIGVHAVSSGGDFFTPFGPLWHRFCRGIIQLILWSLSVVGMMILLWMKGLPPYFIPDIRHSSWASSESAGF